MVQTQTITLSGQSNFVASKQNETQMFLSFDLRETTND